MTATYSLKLSDGEVVHFASDNNKPVAQIKADAYRVLGRSVVDVLDEKHEFEYGKSRTKAAQYMRTYYAKQAARVTR